MSFGRNGTGPCRLLFMGGPLSSGIGGAGGKSTSFNIQKMPWLRKHKAMEFGMKYM